MDREQMAEDIRSTLADANGAVRLAILGNQSGPATEWAAVVRDMAAAYRDAIAVASWEDE